MAAEGTEKKRYQAIRRASLPSTQSKGRKSQITPQPKPDSPASRVARASSPCLSTSVGAAWLPGAVEAVPSLAVKNPVVQAVKASFTAFKPLLCKKGKVRKINAPAVVEVPSLTPVWIVTISTDPP